MSNSLSTFPLLTSQEIACDRVLQLLKVSILGTPLDSFRVRTYPLLMGLSGLGKTEIMRRACEKLDIALCHLSAVSWILYAAKKPGTVECLSGWIEGLKRPGLIFLDELDKLRVETMSTSAWHADAMTEILAVLDGDSRLASLGMKPSVISRLGKDVFFAGAGAWQTLFRHEQKRTMGFGKNGASCHADSLATLALRDSIYGGVPEEILNRFAAPISISPLTKTDYEQALAHVHEKIGEPMPTHEKLDELSEQAEREGIGFRWVERYLTELAIQRMERQEQYDLMPNTHTDVIAERAIERHSEKDFSACVAEIQAKAKEEESEVAESESAPASSQCRGQMEPKPIVADTDSDRGERELSKIWKVIQLLSINVRNAANELLLDLSDREVSRMLSDIAVAAQNIKEQAEAPSPLRVVDVFFKMDNENAKMCHIWRDLSHRFPDIAAKGHLELWVQTLRQFLLKSEELCRS